MYMTRGSLSTVHSTRRFGSDWPRRIIFAAFHVGSKRNGGGVASCVNVGWPFTVAARERGKGARRSIPVEAQFPVERSAPRSACTGKRVAGHGVHNLPLAAAVPYGHLRLSPRQAAVTVRVTAEHDLNAVGRSCVKFDLQCKHLRVTSRSVEHAVGYDLLVIVLRRRHRRHNERGGKECSCKCHSTFPLPLIAASAHIDPRQRLARREKLVGDGDEVILKASPLAARWDVRI